MNKNASKAPPKTILVTGAAGVLARRVIARLSQQHDVIAVDFRRQANCPEAVASYQVDVQKRGFEAVFRKHQIDSIIHIGRIFAHEQSRQQRYNANVLGSKRLFELARKYEVRQLLVHSTYFVYGATPFNPALITEEDPLKASEVTSDLVDAVELENLAQLYLWKYPELNITLLRPSNILGAGVRNSMSLLLSQKLTPVLMGHSPLMQFLHVDDMADAIACAHEGNKPGIYNVAPADWVEFQEAVVQSGCRRLPILSTPAVVPKLMSRILNGNAFFPSYLVNYLKYPVIIDGTLFRDTFGWRPSKALADIFNEYRQAKRGG